MSKKNLLLNEAIWKLNQDYSLNEIGIRVHFSTINLKLILQTFKLNIYTVEFQSHYSSYCWKYFYRHPVQDVSSKYHSMNVSSSFYLLKIFWFLLILLLLTHSSSYLSPFPPRPPPTHTLIWGCFTENVSVWGLEAV